MTTTYDDDDRARTLHTHWGAEPLPGRLVRLTIGHGDPTGGYPPPTVLDLPTHIVVGIVGTLASATWAADSDADDAAADAEPFCPIASCCLNGPSCDAPPFTCHNDHDLRAEVQS